MPRDDTECWANATVHRLTSSADEVEAFNRAPHRADGYLNGARALLTDLQSYLATKAVARR